MKVESLSDRGFCICHTHPFYHNFNIEGYDVNTYYSYEKKMGKVDKDKIFVLVYYDGGSGEVMEFRKFAKCFNLVSESEMKDKFHFITDDNLFDFVQGIQPKSGYKEIVAEDSTLVTLDMQTLNVMKIVFDYLMGSKGEEKVKKFFKKISLAYYIDMCWRNVG